MQSDAPFLLFNLKFSFCKFVSVLLLDSKWNPLSCIQQNQAAAESWIVSNNSNYKSVILDQYCQFDKIVPAFNDYHENIDRFEVKPLTLRTKSRLVNQQWPNYRYIVNRIDRPNIYQTSKFSNRQQFIEIWECILHTHTHTRAAGNQPDLVAHSSE